MHRTLAAILAAFVSIGTLSAFQDRPTMDDMIKWIDYETLLLIFSMMILVAILIDTGIFDYIAVYTFQVRTILIMRHLINRLKFPFLFFHLKLSRGRIWRLISILCVISAIISMFLDNVTTILLMTPITIKLFECLELNPVPVLPFIILNINIAGLTTLIGHPPNLLITGNSFISKKNITFLTFTMHACFGVLVALIQTNLQLRLQHRNIHKILAPIKKSDELIAWKKCMDSITNCRNSQQFESLRLILKQKIEMLQEKTTSLSPFAVDSNRSFESTLSKLKKMVCVFFRKNVLVVEIGFKNFFISKSFYFDQFKSNYIYLFAIQYPIKDPELLKKAGAVLAFIIALFFIESIPSIQRMSLGWCAFTGVVLILLIAEYDRIIFNEFLHYFLY